MDIYFLTPVDKLGGTNHSLPRQKDALDYLKIMSSEQYLMRRTMYRTLAYLESHMDFVTFRYHPQWFISRIRFDYPKFANNSYVNRCMRLKYTFCYVCMTLYDYLNILFSLSQSIAVCSGTLFVL